MSLAITVTKEWLDERTTHAIGTIVASGNYVAGGDTLNFAGKVHAGRAPLKLTVTGPVGYVFVGIIGTGTADNKVEIFESPAVAATPSTATSLSELAAGAYPADIVAATLNFEVLFAKNL